MIFNRINVFYYSELAIFIIYYRLSKHKNKYLIYYPNNNNSVKNENDKMKFLRKKLQV